jgi:hypothetical protein
MRVKRFETVEKEAVGVGKCRIRLTRAEEKGFARPDSEAKEDPLPTKDRMVCCLGEKLVGF